MTGKPAQLMANRSPLVADLPRQEHEFLAVVPGEFADLQDVGLERHALRRKAAQQLRESGAALAGLIADAEKGGKLKAAKRTIRFHSTLGFWKLTSRQRVLPEARR